MTSEGDSNSPEQPSALNTKNLRISSNLIFPEQLSSVHVDKAMVAVDHQTQTATITLLNSHPIPKVSEGWGLDNMTWEVVGEIKIPVPALNALAIYYLTLLSGGVDVGRIIQEAIVREKRTPPKDGFSYGPFDLRQTPIKDESK